MPSYTYKPDPTSGKWNKVNFTDSSHKAIALCGGCKQLKPPIVVRHSTTGKERCATISTPTLDRLKLCSMVSQSIVCGIQAAQASYSGEAQHQKTGRCATISIPTIDRLRLHIIVSYRIV